jgi:hypothetical protein
VKKIAGDQVTDCVDLFSIQEEADTRIMLHALHADEQLKYTVCPTGKGLSAMTKFEINSPRKLINFYLFLLFDKNLFQSGMLLPSFT